MFRALQIQSRAGPLPQSTAEIWGQSGDLGSEPHRVPEGVIPNGAHQACAQRIRNDVASDGREVILASHRTVVES